MRDQSSLLNFNYYFLSILVGLERIKVLDNVSTLLAKFPS
jgi:hypothetical protein